jgi:hypothetical protein
MNLLLLGAVRTKSHTGDGGERSTIYHDCSFLGIVLNNWVSNLVEVERSTSLYEI